MPSFHFKILDEYFNNIGDNTQNIANMHYSDGRWKLASQLEPEFDVGAVTFKYIKSIKISELATMEVIAPHSPS